MVDIPVIKLVPITTGNNILEMISEAAEVKMFDDKEEVLKLELAQITNPEIVQKALDAVDYCPTD